MKIEEIRAIYRELKALNNPVATKAMKLIEFFMEERKAKGRVKKGIDPLHRQIILIFQKNIQVESRDASEFNSWRKIRDIVTPEHLNVVKRFYALPKSKENDATWSRKTTPTILMNNWAAQVDLAAEYMGKIDSRVKRDNGHILPEPKDWRSRCAGALPRYTWEYLCRNWPNEAKALQDPSWKMEDMASEGLAELSSLLGQVDKEIKTTEDIYL